MSKNKGSFSTPLSKLKLIGNVVCKLIRDVYPNFDHVWTRTLSYVKLFIVWEVGETRDDHESIMFKMFKTRDRLCPWWLRDGAVTFLSFLYCIVNLIQKINSSAELTFPVYSRSKISGKHCVEVYQYNSHISFQSHPEVCCALLPSLVQMAIFCRDEVKLYFLDPSWLFYRYGCCEIFSGRCKQTRSGRWWQDCTTPDF